MIIREHSLRSMPREEGATAVEYAIMVALIAAVIIVAVVALGQQASTTFTCVSDAIPDGATANPCD